MAVESARQRELTNLMLCRGLKPTADGYAERASHFAFTLSAKHVRRSLNRSLKRLVRRIYGAATGGVSILFSTLDDLGLCALNVHKREAPKFQITTMGIAQIEAKMTVSRLGLVA